MRDLLARFTNTSKEESNLKQYCRWFQSEKPSINGIVNFNDGTILITVKNQKTHVEQILKSSSNNCYFNIPVSITLTVDEDTRQRLRTFLTAIYAGNDDVRRVNLAMESLVWHAVELPQKMIILRGKGGDGKSAYTALRNNVFADTHKYVSPSVFDKDDEFRRQGQSFSSAKFITFQECNSGNLLQEAIFKSFIGGEKIACRPNYGRETEYFSWEYCGKIWEMNISTPKIKADPNNLPSLKSWIRRLIVCDMDSSFSSSQNEVNVESRVFEEDDSLKKFLNSDVCRIAYIKHQLLPFIKFHTPS